MFCCGSRSCLEHATPDRTDSVMHEYTFNKFRNCQWKYEIRSSFRISKQARTLQATNHSVGAPLPEPQLAWAGRLATPHAICHRLGYTIPSRHRSKCCSATMVCLQLRRHTIDHQLFLRSTPQPRIRHSRSRMQRIGMSLARHPTRVPVQVLANGVSARCLEECLQIAPACRPCFHPSSQR